MHPAPFCIDKLTKFTATYTAEGEPSEFVPRGRRPTGAALDAAPQAHDDHRQPSAAARGRPGLPDQPRVRAAGHDAGCRTARCATTSRSSSRPNGRRCCPRARSRSRARPARTRTSASPGCSRPRRSTEGDGKIGSASPAVSDPVLASSSTGRGLTRPASRTRCTRWTRLEMTRSAGRTCASGRRQTVPGRRVGALRRLGAVGQPADLARPGAGHICCSQRWPWCSGCSARSGVRRRRLWLRIAATPAEGREGGRPGRRRVAYRSDGRRARPQRLGQLHAEFARWRAGCRRRAAGRAAGRWPSTRSVRGRSSAVAGIRRRRWPTSPTGCSRPRSPCYALAMVGYTAEYAFGRVGRTLACRAPARELVGAGGPPTIAPPATGSPGADRTRRRIRQEREMPSRRTMAERIGRWSVVVSVLGALIHAASIAVRAIAVDAVPWSNMYEFASVAGLVGVVAFLGGAVEAAGSCASSAAFILLPVILMMFLAGTVLYSRAQPLVPALQSYWLAIHVTLVSIAEGALMTSAVLTVLYLVKARHDRLSAVAGYQPGSLATSPRGCRPPRRWTRPPTGSSRSPSRCTRSRSSAARSGPRRPGDGTGAGTPRRPGRSSSGSSTRATCMPAPRPAGRAAPPRGSTCRLRCRSPSTS